LLVINAKVQCASIRAAVAADAAAAKLLPCFILPPCHGQQHCEDGQSDDVDASQHFAAAIEMY
jgi:hypothetical protein